MPFYIEELQSAALEDSVPFAVVTPSERSVYSPVVYMLHGMARWDRYYEEPMERSFFEKVGQPPAKPVLLHGRLVGSMQELADFLKVTIVAVNGGNSWYLDSPVIPKSRYETHLINELLPFIQARHGVSEKWAGIIGHSMGGCGSVALLCKHPDRFLCAGSRCGVMEFANQSRFGDIDWHTNTRVAGPLGDIKTHSAFWDAQSPIRLADRIRETGRTIYLDVGAFDRVGLVDSNRRMHEKLLRLGVPHIYRETPDGHEFSPYMWELVVWAASVLGAAHAKETAE